jgi:hypothetical protein
MDLSANLQASMTMLKTCSIGFDHGPANLRSNAGLTKVYSLALDDFIIYDSRVAAALAWLVTRWARETGSHIPDHLKFVCMRAKEIPSKIQGVGPTKIRTPDSRLFPYFAPSTNPKDHRKHAVWNQRANLVLTAALKHARAKPASAASAKFKTVRDVEAALFVMGADLRHALAT